MNSPIICIHIFLYLLSLVKYLYLVNFFKITGRTTEKMWFAKDAIDCPATTYTYFCENLPGAGHELVETGHLYYLYLVSKTWWVGLDHLYWFLKTWWVGLGRIGLGCWLCDFRKSIFFKIIAADNKVPLDGVVRSRHCLILHWKLLNLKWCAWRKGHSFKSLYCSREPLWRSLRRLFRGISVGWKSGD